MIDNLGAAGGEQFLDRELAVMADAGIALFAGRLVLGAQPPVDDATLAAVADRCAGPLPEPLVALWRTTFGGRLDYDLRVDLDGLDVPLSFTELFYPDSGGYHDLWGWIDHECGLAEEHQPDWSGRLTHLPIGGFEYLDRIYVTTEPGPEHGSVVGWRQGLPPGWELSSDDRMGQLAGNLAELFGLLRLEQDPWQVQEPDAGQEMRDAVDDLAADGDRYAKSAAGKLRHLVKAAVLDWRTAVDQGSIAEQRRLRRLALEHAASNDDVALLQLLSTLGCSLGEEIRNGLTPIDLALLHRSSGAVGWLLQHHVSVKNSLQVGAHAMSLDLARELLGRGAAVNIHAIARAVDNDDIEVLDLLAQSMPPESWADDGLAYRLSMLANQAELARNRATAQGDSPTAVHQQRRLTILADLAHRLADHPTP
ncbi:hypothetical protein Rhe02_19620 [Rhizocola hellebori]|uniref:SMI1/KNR4 family protein n=1 Tax=Rhizocola hellebori TaxID=1392758 RepID=A0A8J3VEU8_9ACTN|nr:hypothetical protein [Rhizocola hellebori]GIH03895.1 hypothetical protein Rhe02_19620 [Rhizocola hellebori]